VAKDATGAAARMLMAQLPTVLAFFYRHRLGLRPLYPEGQRPYGEHFLAMLFGDGLQGRWPLPPEATRALDLFLLLHADHEQNCSTSAVRMVASGGASLFASVAAGISALWGPLHGGANMAVLQMLQDIHATGDDGSRFIEKAKTGQAKLMGFGHRVYKRYDPRAAILRQVCEALFKVLHTQDALLDIALRLEQKALSDAYFVERQLYPNVDFYSGILLHALGLPVDFFTALFALGRLPGWMAQWKELNQGGKGRIQRPRQIYIGPQLRPYPGEALPAAQSHASP
jgi:citrate synthase